MSQEQQKSPQVLAHQASPEEFIPIDSIPQEHGHIPFSFEEPPDRNPIRLDSFVGKVSEFRQYLKAERVFMKYGWFGGMKR